MPDGLQPCSSLRLRRCTRKERLARIESEDPGFLYGFGCTIRRKQSPLLASSPIFPSNQLQLAALPTEKHFTGNCWILAKDSTAFDENCVDCLVIPTKGGRCVDVD